MLPNDIRILAEHEADGVDHEVGGLSRILELGQDDDRRGLHRAV